MSILTVALYKTMARTYRRDSRGRFAGVGGGSGGGGKRGGGKKASGGRLKTAAGNRRATRLDRLKGRIGGTVAKPRILKPSGARIRAGQPTRSKMTSIENRLSRVGLAGKRREYKYRAAGADLRLDATKLEKARQTDKRARAYRRKILASAR